MDTMVDHHEASAAMHAGLSARDRDKRQTQDG